MTAAQATILDTIGNTSLLPLRHVVPANGARILLKLESENPTGSMKDRMALAMIEAPEADGRLQPGGAVVEYTGGSTGVSLALVCAVKRHPLDIVTSDAFAKEKLDHMRLLGAKLTIVPSENGRMTEKLTKDMIAEAGRIAKKTGAYLTDQMRNTDQISAYTKLAAEVWEQTGGRIDAFVQSVALNAARMWRRHARPSRSVVSEAAIATNRCDRGKRCGDACRPSPPSFRSVASCGRTGCYDASSALLRPAWEYLSLRLPQSQRGGGQWYGCTLTVDQAYTQRLSLTINDFDRRVSAGDMFFAPLRARSEFHTPQTTPVNPYCSRNFTHGYGGTHRVGSSPHSLSYPQRRRGV